MAAHRYWRLDLLANFAWVAIREIEMRATIGGPDLCSGGTPFASETNDGDPSYLFDNNLSTHWGVVASGQGTCYVGYDFGAPVEIVEIAVSTRDQFGDPNYRIRFATLSYSDDGRNYTTLGPGIGQFFGPPATHVISGFAEIDTSLFRTAGSVTRWDLAWPAGAVNGRLLPDLVRYDQLDGGALRIAGAVKIDDTPDIPVSRRVRLFDQLSGRLVRETWSAEDGSYSFDKIADRKFFVVAFDHTLQDNAAIKDQISPEVPT